MKKVAYAVLILTMAIFLVIPLNSEARGGHGGYGGGHGVHNDWWVPWAIFGWAAIIASHYSSPYYAPPPVVVQEQNPVYAQPVPSSAEEIFVYPRKGQSEEQQAEDRYECHSWAVNQLNYSPTQPTNGMSEAQLNQLNVNYQRAMAACLDGRGYTMR